MSEQQPPKWFDGQAPETSSQEYKRRLAALEQELPDRMSKLKDRPRGQKFLPYLLVRSVVGDRGDRPFNTPFWESPDIWTAPGDPSTSPAVPPTHGGELTAGQPNTVYAHVWNSGLAPLAGIRVEFYWFNPSLAIDGSQANLIGTARCDLSARGMAGSHQLVKCPKPWVPVMENEGHECLVVRVSGIGDPIGNNEWAPWMNRHVAQRNVSVVTSAAISATLLTSLSALAFGTKVELIQLSPTEGDVAAKIVAPRAKLAAQVVTQVLGEIGQDDVVKLEDPRIIPAGVLAPVHPLIEGGAPAAPGLHTAGGPPVIDAGRLVSGLADAERQLKVATLLDGIRALHGGAVVLADPVADEAQIVRLANYDADGQLVGGYTMVLAHS